MNRKTIDFIKTLLEICPFLNSAFIECILYWLPDAPPSTILLGTIGKALVVGLDDFSEHEGKLIFDLIERAMTDESEQFSTVVGTGLIEGMVTKTDEIVGSWEKAKKYLGTSSLAHAEGWRSWGSV